MSPGGVLLIAGLLILTATVGVVVNQYCRQRWFRLEDNDLPTQIAADTGEYEATAFLVAMEASMRLPQRIPLHRGREVRLGRDRRLNTVTLNDISISRRHARISGEGNDFIIQDEGSRGGTFVNRRRLRAGERYRLQYNETVQFYTFTYQFVLLEAPTQVVDGEATIPTRLDIEQIQ